MTDTFKTAIEQAHFFWENQYRGAFLYQLRDAFRLLVDADFSHLEGTGITSLATGLRLTEQFLQQPEIVPNVTNEKAVTGMRTAFEDYVKGDCDWEHLKKQTETFVAWLEHWCSIGNFLYDHKLNFARPFLSVELSNENTVDIYANVSPEHLSLAKTFEFRNSPMALGSDEYDPAYRLINAATDLLLGGLFDDAIEAFAEVEERLPQWRGHCQNSIGVAYFYLRQYEKSLEHYLAALEAGESPHRMEYNVWEACNELYQSTPDRNEKMRWVFFFKEHFPHSQRTFVF